MLDGLSVPKLNSVNVLGLDNSVCVSELKGMYSKTIVQSRFYFKSC